MKTLIMKGRKKKGDTEREKKGEYLKRKVTMYINNTPGKDSELIPLNPLKGERDTGKKEGRKGEEWKGELKEIEERFIRTCITPLQGKIYPGSSRQSILPRKLVMYRNGKIFVYEIKGMKRRERERVRKEGMKRREREREKKENHEIEKDNVLKRRKKGKKKNGEK